MGKSALQLNSIDAFVICGQLSFQMWTKQMQEMLNARKKADVNFREKDFRLAIERYSEVSSRN